MPLPFAPRPEESRVYESLKDVLVSDLTADQFDSLRETVFAQGIDGAEDEYRRLLLLGLAANVISNSGPLAGSAAIKTGTIPASSSEYEVFKPDAGEVWQIMGIEDDLSGGSGSHSRSLFFADGSSSSIFYYNSGSVQTNFIYGDDDNLGQQPIYITNEVYLNGSVTGTHSGGTIYITAIRVR